MSETQPHVLVVDDHRDIRDLIGRYLEKNGFRTTRAENAAVARKAMAAAVIDIVILDIMMPGEDGLSFCRSLRESGDVPVILLTAMAEDTDRVVGLEIGADDYVTKPFNPRELLARIRAVLRRSQNGSRPRDEIEAKRLAFDRFTFDVTRRELVDTESGPVPLSTAEFQMLSAFVKRPNMVLSREQLMDLTSGRSPNVFDRSIDNQVSRLRKKLERDIKNPVLIKTVWGGGYVFATEVSEVAP